MANGAEHDARCNVLVNDLEICKMVNRYMDIPSQEDPGCKHREKRHSLPSVIAFGIIQGIKEISIDKGIIATQAGLIHRKVDQESEPCHVP
jgi:hypothetical protein